MRFGIDIAKIIASEKPMIGVSEEADPITMKSRKTSL